MRSGSTRDRSGADAARGLRRGGHGARGGRRAGPTPATCRPSSGRSGGRGSAAATWSRADRHLDTVVGTRRPSRRWSRGPGSTGASSAGASGDVARRDRGGRRRPWPWRTGPATAAAVGAARRMLGLCALDAGDAGRGPSPARRGAARRRRRPGPDLAHRRPRRAGHGRGCRRRRGGGSGPRARRPRGVPAIGDRHLEAAVEDHLADLLHAAGRETTRSDHQRRAAAAFAELGGDPTDPDPGDLDARGLVAGAGQLPNGCAGHEDEVGPRAHHAHRPVGRAVGEGAGADRSGAASRPRPATCALGRNQSAAPRRRPGRGPEEGVDVGPRGGLVDADDGDARRACRPGPCSRPGTGPAPAARPRPRRARRSSRRR